MLYKDRTDYAQKINKNKQEKKKNFSHKRKKLNY